VIAPVGRAPPAAEAKSEDRAADAARLSLRDEKLGTAHGRRELSAVTLVSFERATPYPEFTRQIEYDTYPHLVASGVIHPYANAERHPLPFPSSPGAGWVPDPPDDP
jgi:hypothetical protein